MRLGTKLVQINRNFVICFAASASASAVIAQALEGHEAHLNTTVTVAAGYAIYYGVFSLLFYRDNRGRYKGMDAGRIKRELLAMVSSFGAGEAIYLGTRWPTLYYALGTGVEPYLASLASEAISTAIYMVSVTILLKKTGTF